VLLVKITANRNSLQQRMNAKIAVAIDRDDAPGHPGLELTRAGNAVHRTLHRQSERLAKLGTYGLDSEKRDQLLALLRRYKVKQSNYWNYWISCTEMTRNDAGMDLRHCLR